MNTTHVCRTCGKVSTTIGFKRDDPVLACGHTQIPPTIEEISHEAKEEAEKQLTTIMRERGVDRDTAETIFIEEASSELTQDTAREKEEFLQKQAQIPTGIRRRREQGRNKRVIRHIKSGPRWLGPIVDPEVRKLLD